jgi:hypothetical protein
VSLKDYKVEGADIVLAASMHIFMLVQAIDGIQGIYPTASVPDPLACSFGSPSAL